MRRWLAWWVAVACAACVARGARELRVLQPDARWSFHVGIAAPPSAAAVVRAFNRTLADVSHTYLAGEYPPHLRRNITLQPLYIELPEDERFRARVLVAACAALGGLRVAALLVVGSGPAAAAVTLAAARAGVPVLRAAPTTADFRHSIGTDLLPLEVRLEVTARETLSAIRATLLHTHWHSFTMLAEADISSALSLRKDLLAILTEPPLNPTLLPLPSQYSRHALFRRLADISRSTRGVIVLICDIHYIQLVMNEAKRLNMLDGHFVWLWIDATQKIDVFHNIGNKTQYADDDHETGRKGSWKNYDNLERKKRSSKLEVEPPSAGMNRLKRGLRKLMAAKEDGVDISDNKFLSASESVVNNDETKVRSKTHSVNGKIDSLSELYDSRNSSLYDINNNIVKKKGVETSKVKRKLNEKVKTFVSDKVSYKRNDKIDYLGGDVNNVEVSNNDVDVFELDRGKLLNVVSSNEVTEELYTSDNSDAELNPTVHTHTVNSFRDIPEKRKDRHFSFNKYNNDEFGDAEETARNLTDIFNSLPVGLLAFHPLPVKTDRWWVRGAVRLAAGALRRVLGACDAWSAQAQFQRDAAASCWDEPKDAVADFSAEFVRELRVSAAATLAGGTERPDRALTAGFEILNLVPDTDAGDDVTLRWRSVGRVLGRAVKLHTIVWPGGDIVVSGLSSRARSVFRVVTARAPPFVMEGELDEDGQCLRGVPCHRLHTNDKDNLTLAFNEMETQERLEEEEEEAQISFFPAIGEAGTFHSTKFFEEQKSKYATHCCYGLAMDLLENIAEELEFDFHLYIVNDGLYGARRLTKRYKRVHRDRLTPGDYKSDNHRYRAEYRNGYPEQFSEEETGSQDEDKWNGIIGDLVSGAAHMSFAALSVSSARAEVVDFSQPYFFSEVSCLAAPTQRSEIPLLAFLLPFSPELWIAIFTSLNVTAIAVAIYEWLSPFGLNPWGRQRSKNFSIASALWVMWGLLCGHLVAFKAPKSWPNKFLINVWGGFSVIFVASYTANIAALIAGLFFHNAVDNYEDRSLMSVRVGAPRASAAEYYVRRDNPPLAQHMRAYSLQDVEEGIIKLRNGSLDLLMADSPILDYYRATDHGCKLQRVGEPLAQDTYAIGMAKGFPLKDSISALISKYSSNGYMDILHEKWYGGLPCFKHATDYGIQPRPLGVAAVAGVFILLGVGVVVGCLILCMEHLFYKYTLPVLRHQPKGTIWRSRNVMFFSQKLYRFINCVELVSPHHAARELVHTLRQGQITSLFQKSVKRKEHEQRRRRRSKAQFFEMIQEIRRVQQEERELPLDPIKEICNKPDEDEVGTLRAGSSPRNLRPEGRIRSPKLFGGHFRSPRARNKRKSVVGGGLNVRRFSTDSILGSDSSSIRESYERTSLNIGRRLSRDVDCLTASPPDINSRRSSYLDVGGQRREVTPSPTLLRADHHISGGATLSFTDVSDGESVAGGSMLAPCSSAAELRVRSPVRRAFSQATCPIRAPVEIRVSEADLPPAPPYPRLAQPGTRSELSRLPEDELVRLWRSSEREVRSALLAALQERRDEEPEPG